MASGIKQSARLSDQNIGLLTGLQSVLQQHGWTVEVAKDLYGAEQVMKRDRPGLLIADADFPDLATFTFCQNQLSDD